MHVRASVTLAGLMVLGIIVSGGCSLKLKTDPFRTPPPTKPALELLPTEPTTIDDLAVNFTSPSTDPLGQSVNYVYEWWRDEEPIEIDGDAVLARQTARDQTWRVRVTPVTAVDGRIGESAEASVEIQNTAPVIQTIGFSNYVPHRNEKIEAFVVVDDVDLDPVSLTYEWLLNDSVIDGEVGPTLKLANIVTLGPDDEIQIRAIPADPEPGVRYTSVSVEVQDDVVRWRPLLPNRNFDDWWTFWDPVHDRVLLIADTPSGEAAFWEMAIDTGTERARFVPIPNPSVLPSAVALKSVPFVYVPGEKRALLLGLTGENNEITTVFELNLEERNHPMFVDITPTGVRPPARVLYNAIYDEVARRLWVFGGLGSDLQGLLDVWSLELGEDPPVWRESPARLTRHSAGGMLVPVPGERRGFVFGGMEGGFVDENDFVVHNRVLEVMFDDDGISFAQRGPLPRAGMGMFGAYVPDDDDPTNDAVYVGAGYSGFGQPEDHIWRYYVNSNSSPTEVEGLTEFPQFTDFLATRAATYDERTGRILIESSLYRGAKGFWVLRPETSSWQPAFRYREDLPPGLALSVRSGLTMWGGVENQLSAVEPYSWTWNVLEGSFDRSIADDEPAVRSSVRLDSDGLLFGGLLGWPGTGAFADVQLWRSQASWTLQTIDEGLALVSRYGHSSFRCDFDWYYFGGYVETIRNDAGRLSCGGGLCTHEDDLPSGLRPSPRAFATAGYDDFQSRFLFGGDLGNGTSSDELWRFNCPSPGPPSWESIVVTGTEKPSGRHGHAMESAYPNDGFLVVGGDTAGSATDVWQLVPNGDGTYRWTELEIEGPAPRPRRHHFTMWDDESQLIMYGGDPGTPRSSLSDLWELRIPGGSIEDSD